MPIPFNIKNTIHTSVHSQKQKKLWHTDSLPERAELAQSMRAVRSEDMCEPASEFAGVKA